MGYEIASRLAEPFTMLMVLAVLGLLGLAKGGFLKNWAGRLVLTAVGVLYVLALPPTAGLLVRTLEQEAFQEADPPADAQAVVVISAGVATQADGPPKLSPGSMERSRAAADVYHAVGPLPVLACGGNTSRLDPPQPDARLMVDFLALIGVPEGDLTAEEQSLSTYENAVEAKRLAEGRGWNRIILVTDAMHLRRARRCFERQGFTVYGSPSSRRSRPLPKNYALWGLPWFESLSESQMVLHEWLGTAWYMYHDRL